jgi:hypothetical protein
MVRQAVFPNTLQQIDEVTSAVLLSALLGSNLVRGRRALLMRWHAHIKTTRVTQTTAAWTMASVMFHQMSLHC